MVLDGPPDLRPISIEPAHEGDPFAWDNTFPDNDVAVGGREDSMSLHAKNAVHVHHDGAVVFSPTASADTDTKAKVLG